MRFFATATAAAGGASGDGDNGCTIRPEPVSPFGKYSYASTDADDIYAVAYAYDGSKKTFKSISRHARGHPGE